jgi:hypothetical protein
MEEAETRSYCRELVIHCTIVGDGQASSRKAQFFRILLENQDNLRADRAELEAFEHFISQPIPFWVAQ